MINIECESLFTAKLNKNAKKTVMITIPIAIVRQHMLEPDDWVEMAFVKRIKGMKGK